MNIPGGGSATNFIAGLQTIIKDTVKNEIEANSCQLIREMFEEIKGDTEFTDKYKKIINDSVDDIIKEITDDLKEKHKEQKDDKKGLDEGNIDFDIIDGTEPESGLKNKMDGTEPESGLKNKMDGTEPESGLKNKMNGGSRKYKRFRKTKGGKLHNRKSKKIPKRKYTRKHKHSNKSTIHGIMTSVKRECTCIGPKGCTCVESKESITDPPNLMVGGTPCDGVI